MVGLLAKGTKVNITGKTGNWHSISYNGKTDICRENKDTIKSVYKQHQEDQTINNAGPSEESKNNPLDIILREKGYPQSVIVKLTESEKQEFSQYEGNYRQY